MGRNLEVLDKEIQELRLALREKSACRSLLVSREIALRQQLVAQYGHDRDEVHEILRAESCNTLDVGTTAVPGGSTGAIPLSPSPPNVYEIATLDSDVVELEESLAVG